ncbi:MAG TPA: 3-oxoacyl-ACP reductase FabG [Clostridia bacterium]|nr:3-oxoacyl-ACP reductase FabG [Clostridia bacterium]
MSKTALVTGAAGGIGSAAARFFAREGYNVIINYRHSKDAAMALEAEIRADGGTALVIQTDVADEGQVAAMFKRCTTQFGGVDVLVNNAGIAQQKLFTDITQADFDEMFGVSVKGTFNCCQKALPYMVHQKRGKIINISSIWGVCGASCEVHYSAAKAGVIGMTKALAKEVAPSNIQVNCITPGIIATAMNAAFSSETLENLISETPLGRLGSPEDVAEIIVFLASEKADFITGQVIGVDGGFN